MDNISVVEIDHCSLEDCIRTDGDEIASGPFHYKHPYGPWVVDNLDNIESAENITIYNQWYIPLRYLPDVYSVNGIDNPIFWDGKSSGGTPFSQGQYIWEMDLTNECGTTTYHKSFFIDHSVTKPIPSFSAYNEISTPRPCCEDLPDIYIDYNLSGAGLEFIATNSITLEDMTIMSDVEDLIFQAENSITFLPGFKSQLGAEFEASIKPCFNDTFEDPPQ